MVEFILTYYLVNVEIICENLEFQTNIGLFYNFGSKCDAVRYSSRHKRACRNLLRALEEEDGQK